MQEIQTTNQVSKIRASTIPVSNIRRSKPPQDLDTMFNQIDNPLRRSNENNSLYAVVNKTPSY